MPQSGNLSLHLDNITKTLPQWIPDPEWNGNAVLDFEAWTTGYKSMCIGNIKKFTIF